VRLYHLTSIYHTPSILSSGYLKRVESNIVLAPGRQNEHRGPDVVWLTTDPRPGQGWGHNRPPFEYVDKCRVIFDVDVPDHEVHHWWEWADEHGMSEPHKLALAVSGDERNNVRLDRRDDPGVAQMDATRAMAWYVVEREVAWLEWVSVRDRYSGECIWRQTDEQLRSGTLVIPRLYHVPRLAGEGPKVMTRLNDDPQWMPTTILAEDTGAYVQIGGDGPPDLVLDARGLDDEGMPRNLGRARSVAEVRDLLAKDDATHTIPLTAEVAAALESYRQPGDDDDAMVRRALLTAEGKRLLTRINDDKPDWDRMTDADRRAYFDKHAPSINVMRDLMDGFLPDDAH
jgi:hypothetical protein